MSIRIVLAEDHSLVRAGIRSLLRELPDVEVVAEADNGRDALTLIEKHKPDLVLMDISMPEMNGLEATRQILKDSPEIQVLILSMHESEHLVHEVLASGARGYVLKADAGNDLIMAPHRRGGP